MAKQSEIPASNGKVHRHGIGHNGGPRFDGLSDRLLYDVEEARQLLGGIGRSTLYKIAKERGVDFDKVGSRSFLTLEKLRRVAGLDERTEGAPRAA